MDVKTFYNAETHTIAYAYNAVKKVYADGTKKIKYHTYNSFKGLNRKKSGGVSSSKDKLRSKYKHLYTSKSNLIDLIYHNSLIKPWEYFVTLTFDPKIVDSLDYSEVSETLQKWTDNMKHQNPNMSYVLVPELHESGRIHWHGVFSNVPNWKLTPARSAKTGRLIYKKGVQIFNLSNYKYGHTTVSRIQNQKAVSVYCSEYMTKDLIDLNYKKRYWASRNLERPNIEYAYFDEETLQFYIENCELDYSSDKTLILNQEVNNL